MITLKGKSYACASAPPAPTRRASGPDQHNSHDPREESRRLRRLAHTPQGSTLKFLKAAHFSVPVDTVHDDVRHGSKASGCFPGSRLVKDPVIRKGCLPLPMPALR